jgi:hypothetical protein
VRASTRRPTLETLEDRVVLSSANLFPPTLLIIADPARSILLQKDSIDPTKLDVKDGATLLGQFPIAAIKSVGIQVAGNDTIKVDDSNGFPLAPLTIVSLFGSGVNNSLQMQGSQAINSEQYIGGNSSLLTSLSLDGVKFQLTGAVATVIDEVPDTSTLFVQTTGPAVILSGSSGLTEQFTGLATAGQGGGTLIFAGKAFVDLDEGADNATLALDATVAAPGSTGLSVNLIGKNDTLIVNATPATVGTVVQALGLTDHVNLRGNAGFVNILGNSTAGVVLGSNPSVPSNSVTAGINQGVGIVGVGNFVIANGGNGTTNEQVTVTESTIAGTGLFGNSSVVVHYNATIPIIQTGRLANTYTVAPSAPGAHFSKPVFISDEFSLASALNVLVTLDSGSGLFLSLFNKNPNTGSLFISAPGGTFNPFNMTKPNGTETVTFGGGLTSTVIYAGFMNPLHS